MHSLASHTLPGILAAWFAAIALPASGGAADAAKEWRFRVYLDDQEVGYHHFHLTQADTATRLISKAEMQVTFLKIPFFTYRHENIERWNGACLESIDSVTDENGERYRVNGNAGDDGFRVTGSTGEAVLPDCISTFAYWDKAFLQQGSLLNAQTGEYIDVQVDYLGEQPISAGDTTRSAHRYRLETDDLDLELWYSQEGHWLALQSTVDGGRLLRYVIE
ncbi:MAG TPA: DUF6134 family protein [Gammaproteobacteria bacterium]|nr:DUF6134 family protein [Gammaproteobacteria bacterium]